MYVAFYKMRSVARDEVPSQAQQSASPILWLCMAENGSVLLADQREEGCFWWDARTHRWRECGINSVMLREGSFLS
jgi:hypothetical protein